VEAIANLFPEGVGERALLLKSAIEWSAKKFPKQTHIHSQIQGEPFFHHMLAKTYRHGKIYHDSHSQYVFANVPKEHAEMINEWS